MLENPYYFSTCSSGSYPDCKKLKVWLSFLIWSTGSCRPSSARWVGGGGFFLETTWETNPWVKALLHQESSTGLSIASLYCTEQFYYTAKQSPSTAEQGGWCLIAHKNMMQLFKTRAKEQLAGYRKSVAVLIEICLLLTFLLFWKSLWSCILPWPRVDRTMF